MTQSRISGIYGLIFGFLALLFLPGCGESESSTVLELRIYDFESAEREGVKVVLYPDSLSWINEENALQDARFTDSEGVVSFYGLDDGTYFIDAVSGSLNNWENRVKIDVQGNGSFSVSTRFLIIGTNKSGLLAAGGGKYWKAVSYQQNFADITDLLSSCDQGLVYGFFKGGGSGKLVTEYPENCITSTDKVWKFNETATSISIMDTNGKLLETWTISSLTEDEMIWQQVIFPSVLTIRFERKI